jgi:hypothetical protein
MAFKLPQFGKGSTAAKPATKKAAATVKKAVGTVKKAGTVSTGTRKGGVGYRSVQRFA